MPGASSISNIADGSAIMQNGVCSNGATSDTSWPWRAAARFPGRLEDALQNGASVAGVTLDPGDGSEVQAVQVFNAQTAITPAGYATGTVIAWGIGQVLRVMAGA